ncbi:MAG TPA: VOC family protein [Candidatus Limnocylindria bacterium]|nr:VOC family protein [Candidatus Limnocylindria bacterium]
MGEEGHGPKVGPVFAFTAKRADVETFYRDVVGLAVRSSDHDAAWLETSNADVVVHAREDTQTPREVSRAPGFVVWFGVAHLDETWERARKAGATVGEFRGDHFFARDPDGRYVGVYEEHGHDHDH